MSNIQDPSWEEYGYKVQMLIEHPKNAGTIEPAEAKELDADLFIYEYGSEEIGEKITLYWAIDSSDDTIVLSRFTAFGSPATIAANEMSTLLTRNKTVEQATEINYKGLEYFLRDNPNSPALPDSDNYAITMALDAIRRASMEYYNDKELNSPGEEMVSNDSPMSLKAIRDSIKLHDIKSVQELSNYTKAGRHDTASIERVAHENRTHYLADIIKSTQEELEAQKAEKKIDTDMPFRQMDAAMQIDAINRAIDDSGVRQYLIMDGGNMEILDVKLNGEDIDIYIRYLGACSGCASSTTGTLFAIETTLKEKLDEKIRVLPL